ncbi:MAG: response regulator [Thiobacillus sp.]|jgi:DNA-binding NarL/FixJ family response regulator|uniref:response regulator transcription factor n=1 Tax=Thiobacillus sp. TaxID=924 RepID=UPI00289458E5|nr:response regulator [Thiobacillus sp.]MDT3708195.1 response regulator [Thiobacillus sp.]
MINVLIAEDNAAYRRSLHQMLAKRSPFMHIAESADGVDALHQALGRHYDLIFMDVRLPHGNGLDLTRAIKGVFASSIVCVITIQDLPEYRDAALRNGADHLIVKGESTTEEIAAMVESLLETRYRALILVGDALYRRQLSVLLSARWPLMIVAEAANAAEGIGHAAMLKPDLVLLDLGLQDTRIAELVQDIRRVSTETRFIGMTSDDVQAHRVRAMGCGMDYFVPLGPSGHTELALIVHALQPEPGDH